MIFKRHKPIRPTEDALEAARSAVKSAADAVRPVRVLFVCLGNICRSPAAQGVMEKMAADRGLDKMVECDSAGFYGGHRGQLPDIRMREAALHRGYHLDHRSRTVTYSDFIDFDLIVGMDRNNLDDLHRAAPSHEMEKKIIGMIDYTSDHPDDTYVPDPYYEGAAGFQLVLNLLEDACSNLLDILTYNAAYVKPAGRAGGNNTPPT